MVLQHSEIESKALPMLKMAASKCDISLASIAMLEDRILDNSGKNKYTGRRYIIQKMMVKRRLFFQSFFMR